MPAIYLLPLEFSGISPFQPGHYSLQNPAQRKPARATIAASSPWLEPPPTFGPRRSRPKRSANARGDTAAHQHATNLLATTPKLRRHAGTERVCDTVSNSVGSCSIKKKKK